MASGTACITRGCSQAQQSLVERCFAGASKKVKEAALVAVQQLPVRCEEFFYTASAADLLRYAVQHAEDRQLSKLLVQHNKELAEAELVYAASYGNEERMQQLLAEGIPVDARDEYGRTPLLAIAARLWDTPVDLQLRSARMLLEAGATVNATVPSNTTGLVPKNATALWESISHNHFALAHLLLDAGASPAITLFQETLLYALVSAACHGLSYSPPDIDIKEVEGLARRLVAAGVPVDGAFDSSGLMRSPLILAVTNATSGGLQCEQLLGLVETLLDLGADPRVQDDIGRGVLVQMIVVLNAYKHRTPLHLPNFQRLLQRLVAAGADLHTRCELGFTVMGIMCSACANPALGPPEPLLRALVDAGADLLAEQPEPLPHMILTMSPGPNTPATLRALAALGYPMNVEHTGMTPLMSWLSYIITTCGIWPDLQPPSPLQLSCLEALVDVGCPLVASPGGSSEHAAGSRDSIVGDAAFWLAEGISTGSLAVVQALLRVCPEAARSSSKNLNYANALEDATKILCKDLEAAPEEELEEPLEGPLRERVLWYCTVAPLLLAAGSPPPADKHLDLSALPLSCQEQLRFLPLVAHGASWSPEKHHLFPPAFCAASRQLLLVHECCGFGASEPSSVQVPGAGRKRRAGSRRSRKPARAMGIQLPQGILHHILEMASQPLVDWVTLQGQSGSM